MIKEESLRAFARGYERFIEEERRDERIKTLKEVEKIIIKPPKRAKILTGNNEEILGFILKKDWERVKGEGDE